MKVLARIVGVALLVLLTFGWVETVTWGAIERSLGVDPGVIAGSMYGWTPAHWVLQTVFLVVAAVVAMMGVRLGMSAARAWGPLLAVMCIALAASACAWKNGTPLIERLAGLQSAVVFGIFWAVAGAGLGWQGRIPPAIGVSRALRVLLGVLLVTAATVTLLLVGGIVYILWHGSAV